jgi:hypothetical protein
VELVVGVAVLRKATVPEAGWDGVAAWVEGTVRGGATGVSVVFAAG